MSRFVGRARELALLHERLEQAVGGQGEVIGIAGEPGLGKSRLLVEFARSLEGQAVTYCEGHCLAYGSATPYLPVLALLHQRCGITDGDAPDVITAKVHQALWEVDMAPDEAAPVLLRLLDVPGDMTSRAALSPAALKARTFAVLRHLCLHQKQPCVLAVENLHWIDPTSEEWLTSLVEQVAGAALLLLVTYRPGYRPAWIAHSVATQLALSRLTPRDSLAVVQSVPQAAQLPASLHQAIVARAAGNPFFLEELTWAAVERGSQAPDQPVPDTIQAVLTTRIDRLPPADKRLLQTTAVMGIDVSVPLLHAITALPEATLHDSLGRLQTAEFLFETHGVLALTYTFKHALTQEVAYQSLLRRTRKQVHQRIAQVVEAQFPTTAETQPELVAQHYTEAGCTEPAIACWQRAGQQALRRSANREAAQHLTQGLALLATLPETQARAQQELDLLITLGPALMATKGYATPEVEQTYARARALCQQLGEMPQLFPTLWGLWRFYEGSGALVTARELGEQLYRLAQHTATPMHLLEAHNTLGSTLFFLGEYAAAWRHLEQGIAFIDPTAQRALVVSHDMVPGVACLTVAALTLWCLGFPVQAGRRCQEALALAHALNHPQSLVRAQHYAAFLHHCRREAQAVQAQAEALLTLATAQGFPLFVGLATCWQGWALAMQGQGEVGLAQLRQGLAALLATGETLAWSRFLVLLAEAVGHASQIDEGLCLLAEALAAMAERGRGESLAEAYRLQGEFLLRLATPDVAQAEACFQQALAIARRQQAKSWELRAAMSLSQLWQHQGKRTAARQLLAPIYGWFIEGFDTPDLQEAQALLETL